MISPHAWGWPDLNSYAIGAAFDFPTRVGMAQIADLVGVATKGFPHTRGDGPF